MDNDIGIAKIKRMSILQRATFVGSRLTVFSRKSFQIARASSSNSAAWRGEIASPSPPVHKLKLIKLPAVQLSKSGVASKLFFAVVSFSVQKCVACGVIILLFSVYASPVGDVIT